MRLVIQRVISARVEVDGRVVGEIGAGLLVFVGVERGDGASDVSYAAGKIRDLRVFEDAAGKMKLALAEINGAVLVISQFTLCGDCRKGRRPSFDDAAAPAEARDLYESLVMELQAQNLKVQTGEFQADMKVELTNDGPVTLLLDSRRRW